MVLLSRTKLKKGSLLASFFYICLIRFIGCLLLHFKRVYTGIVFLAVIPHQFIWISPIVDRFQPLSLSFSHLAVQAIIFGIQRAVTPSILEVLKKGQGVSPVLSLSPVTFTKRVVIFAVEYGTDYIKYAFIITLPT